MVVFPIPHQDSPISALIAGVSDDPSDGRIGNVD